MRDHMVMQKTCVLSKTFRLGPIFHKHNVSMYARLGRKSANALQDLTLYYLADHCFTRIDIAVRTFLYNSILLILNRFQRYSKLYTQVNIV